MTPTCPDQSQNYSDLIGSIRSPLQGYGDSNDESVMSRGGFAYWEIVSNPVSTGAAQALTAVVDLAVCEPLFLLSPYFWGCGNGSAFFNVTTMDFNITFLGLAGNRVWSHDTSLGALPVTSSSIIFNGFANPAFSFSQIGLGACTINAFPIYHTTRDTSFIS